jgi:RNA polymerase sigma-70 factor (ECF subfamily)
VKPVKVSQPEDSKSKVMLAPASGPSLAASHEGALLGRCVSGDEAAWRDLYRVYFPVAAAFLRKLGVRERELDDATQEVFVQLFRYLPKFRGEAQLKTWLYKLCATQARRVRRWRAVSHTLDRLFSTEEAVTGMELSEGAARVRVSAALEKLNEGERLVLVLYEFEGLSGEDIATVAGCPVATVWRRLHYARKRFAEALGVAEEAN